MSCLDAKGRRPKMELSQLHGKSPVITHVEEMILPDEADYLIKLAETIGMTPSTVETKGGNVPSQARTSHTAFIPKSHNAVVECIEKRIATVAQQPHSHLEPLQVTRYRDGQKYEPHHDYFHHNGDKPQRTTTVFTYLSGVPEECGGKTSFPKINVHIPPISRNAVVWSNRTMNGGCNEDTLHAGNPVTCKFNAKKIEKIGLNAWFQDEPWN